MRMSHLVLSACLTMVVAPGFGGFAWAESADDAAAVVQAFNGGITSRDKDAAVAQLAGGGVQFTLRAQHEGADPDKLVTPIADYWSMIIPVLFASTSSYTRDVEIIGSDAHGDVATVWTRTRTASVRLGAEDADINEFTEAYLLVSTADGWRIAAIADNRRATAIGAAAE